MLHLPGLTSDYTTKDFSLIFYLMLLGKLRTRGFHDQKVEGGLNGLIFPANIHFFSPFELLELNHPNPISSEPSPFKYKK